MKQNRKREDWGTEGWDHERHSVHTKWFRLNLISNREPRKIFEQRRDMSSDVTEEDLFGNSITHARTHAHARTHTDQTHTLVEKTLV